VGGIIRGFPESAIAVIDKNRDIVGKEIRDCQVLESVIIEIFNHHKIRLVAGRVIYRRAKQAETIINQDRHVIRDAVGDRDIQVVIVVDIPA